MTDHINKTKFIEALLEEFNSLATTNKADKDQKRINDLYKWYLLGKYDHCDNVILVHSTDQNKVVMLPNGHSYAVTLKGTVCDLRDSNYVVPFESLQLENKDVFYYLVYGYAKVYREYVSYNMKVYFENAILVFDPVTQSVNSYVGHLDKAATVHEGK